MAKIRASLISVVFLLMCSIPFVSVFGTYMVTSYRSNILLLFLMVLISSMVILIFYSNFISAELCSLAIFVIAIALLYHYSLFSAYLSGWDIHLEYYFSNLVAMNSSWDPTIPNDLNSMTSIVMLCPIYSIILGIDNIWVFKAIYPLLFSLVPVVLYRVYRRLVDEKTAFLSVFFFMSFFTFFTEMTALARQQIAELFFVLLILLMVDEGINSKKVKILSTIFGISLITAHYGLSYVFMFFYLIFPWILLFILKKLPITRFLRNISPPLQGNLFYVKKSASNKLIVHTFILLYVTFALAWYIFVSGSASLKVLLNLGNHLWNNLFTEFFNPRARDPFVALALGKSLFIQSLQREIHRILQYMTQVFIIIGFSVFIINRHEDKINEEYFIMIFMSMALILMAVILPYFAGYLRMTRLYHITLFFLSPFCILGGVTFFKWILKLFGTNPNKNKYAHIMLLFILIAYFMFNTGFIQEVTADIPSSCVLGYSRIVESNTDVKLNFNGFYVFEEEVSSAEWISRYREKSTSIFADEQARVRILPAYGMIPLSDLKPLTNKTIIYEKSYIYLKRLNVVDGLVTYIKYPEGIFDYFYINEILLSLSKLDKIYSNGGSDIYGP
jgi:uncharacterized membrane protein